MAGTVSVTSRAFVTPRGASIVRYDIDWTSTAGGAVSANPFSVVRGDLFQIKFVPDSGGTQPTDLYDVTLIDEDSVDLLNDGSSGRGSNLSNASGAYMQWDPPIYLDAVQQLDLVVANAGNAKGGVVSIWVRE